MGRLKISWEKMTQKDTPLVSREYVERAITMLYWLGLFVAAIGIISGIIASIVVGSFMMFVSCTLFGLGVWLGLFVTCCFLTLGVLKVRQLEKANAKNKEHVEVKMPELVEA